MATAVATMPDGSIKMSDGTIVRKNTKKNVPSVKNADGTTTTSMAGRVNTPTVKAPYAVASMPDGSIKMSDGTIVGKPVVATPSILTSPIKPTTQSTLDSFKPVQTVSPTAVKTAGGFVYDSNKVYAPELESTFKSALDKANTFTPKKEEAPVVASMAGRKNVPSTPTLSSIATSTQTTTPTTPTGAEKGTATTSTNKGLSESEQLSAQKESELTKMKEADIAARNLELSSGTEVLKTNNKLLMRMYGIDENGNVDTTNINGLAYKIEQSKLDYQNQKNQLLGEYSSGRLRKVQSQIRQMLTSRGIDITKVPQEQLIQLSGEVGATAFNDIFTAKEKTVNDILDNGAKAEDKINALREKGLLSQNDLRVATETLRSKVLNDINTINKQFANDIFGLKDKAIADKDSKKAAAINAITQFGTSLGLTGNKLGAITSYMNNFSNAQDALTAMIQDLSTPTSALYKTVGSIEAANLMARQAQAALEERKVAATELSAQARAVSAAKSGGEKKTSLNATQQNAIISVEPKLAGVKTLEDLNDILAQASPEDNQKIRNALGKVSAIDQLFQNQ